MTYIATHSTIRSTTADAVQPARRGRLRAGLRAGLLSLVLASACVGGIADVVAAAPMASRSAVAVDDPTGDAAAAALDLLTRVTVSASGGDVVAYDRARSEIATEIASRVGVDAAQLSAAWASADYPHQRALLAAISQLGVPYRFKVSQAGYGFDCSGLTSYAWEQAGVDIPRQSTAQIRAAAARTLDNAQAGDLIQYPGHVMMWLGVDRAIIHAPRRGRLIEVGSLPAGRRIRIGDPTE